MSETTENSETIKNGLDSDAAKLTKDEEMGDESSILTNSKVENEETEIKNGNDASPKKDIDELIDEIEEDSHLLNLSASARMISLKMLLKSKILIPGQSVMTVEYLVSYISIIIRFICCGNYFSHQICAKYIMEAAQSNFFFMQGQKFYGDLLEDGRIKSQETEAIFCSPSAWAINCKRIINPDKKSGVGWSSIKYKGKKLDVYKALYQKRCMEEKIKLDATCAQEEQDLKIQAIKKEEEYVPPPKRSVLQHSALNRFKE